MCSHESTACLVIDLYFQKITNLFTLFFFNIQSEIHQYIICKEAFNKQFCNLHMHVQIHLNIITDVKKLKYLVHAMQEAVYLTYVYLVQSFISPDSG